MTEENQITRRLDPRALLGEARLWHFVAAILCGSIGAGLLLACVMSLPKGLLLLLPATLLLVWTLLSITALKANASYRSLLDGGVVVLGQLIAIHQNGQVEFQFEPEERGLCTQISPVLSSRALMRFQPGMQVGVLFDPTSLTAPGEVKAHLFPPPSGGTQSDLVGDCFNALLRQFNRDKPPEDEPKDIDEMP